MARPRRDKPRGILGPMLEPPTFRLERYFPSDDLAPFVEHYWTVVWDLHGGPPRTQETLPHPSVHLVFEAGRSEIVGVMRGKFARELCERGRVFAAKFRPGGFQPFLGAPVATITGRTLAVGDVFPVDVPDAERAIMAAGDDDERIARLESVLRTRTPLSAERASVGLVVGIVEAVEKDPAILKVEDLVARAGVDRRALQRLFRAYVGASPKWVIRRYRLLEAAERIAEKQRAAVTRESGAAARGDDETMAELSASLGYFDQAHFIRDFRSIVGASPGAYARSLAAAARPGQAE